MIKEEVNFFQNKVEIHKKIVQRKHMIHYRMVKLCYLSHNIHHSYFKNNKLNWNISKDKIILGFHNRMWCHLKLERGIIKIKIKILIYIIFKQIINNLHNKEWFSINKNILDHYYLLYYLTMINVVVQQKLI